MILVFLWVLFPLLAGAVLYGLERLVCWLDIRFCWVLPLMMAVIAFFAVRTGLRNNPDTSYLLTFFFVPQGIGWTAGLALGVLHGWRGPKRFRRPKPPREKKPPKPRTLRESRKK